MFVDQLMSIGIDKIPSTEAELEDKLNQMLLDLVDAAFEQFFGGAAAWQNAIAFPYREFHMWTKVRIGTKEDIGNTVYALFEDKLYASMPILITAFDCVIGRRKCIRFHIASTDQTIDNPYFKCNSLDEVKVTIDLL